MSGDLRLGGRYQLQGNAGGEILVCDPPKHLKITWEYGGDTSWVEVRIDALAPDSARLTLEHIARDSDHWKKFGPGATGVGWDMALIGLTATVEPARRRSVRKAMQWMMSDEGKSSRDSPVRRGVRRRHRGGTDPAAAKAAADKTTAAYTGA